MAGRGIIVAIAVVIVLSGLILPTHASGPSTPTVARGPAAMAPSVANHVPLAPVTDQGWQPPQALESQTATFANLAGVALSASGSGMVVYQAGGIRNTLMATHFVPNGGGDGGTNWQVPVQISNSYNDIGYAFHGAVAMDAAGDAMAVYYTWNNFHGYTIYAAYYHAGVGWQAPVAIDQPHDYSFYPVVAMNAVGDVFAVWQVWNGAYYSIWANRYLPGTGWGTAGKIESTTNYSTGQDVAVDGAGNAIAVWYEADGFNYHVYGARFSTSVGWLTPLLLETSTNYAWNPSVAMDSGGNGVVAWEEFDGQYNIWSALYNSTTGWSPATMIDPGIYYAGYNPGPDVAASNGNASVVWTMQNVSGAPHIYVNRYVAGSGWVGTAQVDPISENANSARVAMDATGNVTVTYLWDVAGATPANQVVVAAVRYNHLTTLWTYNELDYTRVGSGQPLVAIDGHGNALAAWNYNDQGDPTMAARNGILTNHYTNTTGWQYYWQAQVAEWDDNIAPQWLQLETNVAGDAIFSFTQNDGPIWNGYAVLYTPAGGWGRVTRIAYFNASGVTEEWSAIDGAGNALVLFRASNGTQFNIYATYYSVGSGWGTPQRLDTAAGSSKDWLRIAMNNRGDGVAIWDEWNGTNWNAYSAFFNRTTHTWGLPLEVQSTFTYLGSVVAGLDGTGNAMAVYNAWNGSGYSNYASYYRPSTGWGSPVQIDHTTMSVNTPYALSMNEAGEFAVSWSDWNGTRDVAVANVFSPATGWGPSTAFSSVPGEQGAATPSLDPAGDALMAYVAWDGTQYNGYAVYKPAGGAWGAAVRITSGSGGVTQMASSLDYHGNGFISWSQYNGMGYDTLARRYVAGVGWMPQATVNSPAPATPATSSGSSSVGVDGHGNAILAWNEWENGALLPFATKYIVGNGQPSLVLTSPANGTLTNNPSVVVTGTTDPGATVTIDGSPVAVAANGSFTHTASLADGLHTFLIVALNAAGLSTEQSISVTVKTSAPTLTISSPVTGSLTRDPAAQVTGTTEPGATVAVNGIQASVSSGGAFSVAVPLQQGSNTLTALATDPFGNTASASVTVTLDTTAPPLSLASPSSGPTDQSAVVVSGSTEVGANVSVDGTAVSVGASGNFTATLTLADGPHTIVVVATDGAGNQATVTVQVTVDTTPPPLAITSPSTGSSVTAPTVLVTGTAEFGATLVVNGYSVSVTSGGTFSIQLPLTGGSNTITATETDTAGNVATTSVTVSYNDQVTAVQNSVNTANTLVLVAIGLAAAALAVGAVSMVRGRKTKASPAEQWKEQPPGPSPP